MSEKMTVLFVAHTGHVLAAATHGAALVTSSPAALAEGGLALRRLQESFTLDPAELQAATVEPMEPLLLQPFGYRIVDGTPEPVAAAANPLPAPVLAASQVTVNLPAPAAEETPVWVHIEGGSLSRPVVVMGKVPETAGQVALQIASLDPDTYRLLTLVPGLPPLATSHQVP